MKTITQADLRSLMLPADCKEYIPPPGVFITPGAREYLASRGIALKEKEQAAGMPVSVIEDRGSRTFVNAETGAACARKPEHMTHLRANLLVSKADPRIAFRGILDSLEADILEAQILASESGNGNYCNALEEVLGFVREIMSAEVNCRPLAQGNLFGLSLDEIHEQSHRIKDYFGIPHPVPNYAMGVLAMRLNTLRTHVREAELEAVRIFSPEGENSREDIIRALNRLSSAIYWLFCSCVSGRNYGG